MSERSTPHATQPQAIAGDRFADSDGGRLGAVRRAAQRWQNELLDTSGHNRLRNYRDLKTGTLDLGTGGPSGVSATALNRLLAGRTVRLSDLFPTAASEGATSPFDDALRRMKAIHKSALSYHEEKGIDTCFVGVGLAT